MESKRRVLTEWGKNVLILLLAIMALTLIRQSTLFEGFDVLSGGIQQGRQTTQQVTFHGDMSIAVQAARIAVQNEAGRYGMQYNSKVIDPIFEEKLGSILREALSNAHDVQQTNRADWQQTIRSAKRFLYCDFMSNLPLRDLPRWLGNASGNENVSGMARRFLLVEASEGYKLYFFDDAANAYSFATTNLTDAGRFASICDEFEPNGALFAFEQPDQYPLADDNVMVLPSAPSVVRYEAQNPMADMDNNEREDLMRKLSFNPSLTTPYESADAFAVIREGTDTLRMLHTGTVVFQSQGGEQARFRVDQADDARLIENVQELLGIVLSERTGEATPYLLHMLKKEDGTTELTFAYRLGGVPVKVGSKGWAAQFVVKNGAVEQFTVHMRQYAATQEQAVVLPESQMVGVALAKNVTAGELTLSYIDMGQNALITVDWLSDLNQEEAGYSQWNGQN